MKKIIFPAYAKINLFLDIDGVYQNGYHKIRSVMQTIDLFDKIELEENPLSNKFLVLTSDTDIPVDESNTVYKAVLYFRELCIKKSIMLPSFKIHLNKIIPEKAGLGGGSANAAAVLRKLCYLYTPEKVTLEELLECSTKVGADVPFCILGGTCFCKSRELKGDVPTKIKDFSDGVFLIIKPDFSFSTKEAYDRYDKFPISPVSDTLYYNIFEKIQSEERIYLIKNALLKVGAKASLMTGSGSSVFGVFSSIEEAKSALFRLRKIFSEEKKINFSIEYAGVHSPIFY